MALPKVSQEDEAREQHRRTLHDVIELAAQFFQATLAVARRRQGARLSRRPRARSGDAAQVPASAMRRPSALPSRSTWAAQGVSVEDMIEAGLLVSGDDIPVPYDRFRDRVMFPITDLRGRIIAFGGRALEKDAQAKYLNSPETPLFHKGGTLYNSAACRAQAGKTAPAGWHRGRRLCRCHRLVSVGFEAAVAPLGTALTADQLVLLWKMADEPILCFDGDGAGRRAAYRAVDLALPLLMPGKSLKFAMLPDGQDPDDLVRSGGREAVAEVLSAARPLVADAVDARDRGRRPRYAGAPRRVRGAHRRGAQRHRRRDGAQVLPARVRRPSAAVVRGRRGTPFQRDPRRERVTDAAAGGRRRVRALRAAAAPPSRPRTSRFRRRIALRGREPAAAGEPGSSRPPLRHSAPRSPDPAGDRQSSLARARSPGGARRHRVPPCRHAEG